MLKFDQTESSSQNTLMPNEKKEDYITSHEIVEIEESKQSKIESFLSDMPDIVCMSHLRWDFVFQRPQHLLTRFAQHGRLFYFEEPKFYHGAEPRLELTTREGGNINIVVAHLPNGLTPQESDAKQIEIGRAHV